MTCEPDKQISPISPTCTQLALLALQENGRLQKLILFVANPKKLIDLLKMCQQALPSYLMPQQIIVLSQLPYNKNGKVDYLALKKIYDTRRQAA